MATERARRDADAAMQAAMESEAAIVAEAADVRGDAELTGALFMKLRPLLRRPIPDAFIVSTPSVKGKPYDSTGVKSVQVLSDRMDAVLTPFWWWEEIHYFGDDYERGGNLCEVTVHVGVPGERPLFSRTSRGGVNQASTLGNRYKGSYTNAAKRAFAAVGPGHEIYLGAADLDPDTNPDAAKQQERSAATPAAAPLPPNIEGAVTLAQDAVKRGFVPKEELLVRLQALGAGDTSSVTHALAGLPEESVELVRSQLADLIAAGEEAAHA